MKNCYLITGATAGLGKKIALELANQNYSVIISGRNKKKLEKIFKIKKNINSFITIDFERENNFEELKNFFLKKKIKLNGVIHFGAIHNFSPLRSINYEIFKKVYKINVFSLINLIKFFSDYKYRDKKNSSIVSISSVSSLEGNKGISLYSSSKAASNNLVKCYAKELANKKIRINSIIIGHTNEGMGKKINTKLNKDQINELLKKHPLGFGGHRDVLSAVKFLISDESKWITGTELVVDGGYLL